MPDVSIVIISWKMKDLLKVCLNSIFKYSKDITFEILLVDNNSRDGTYEMVVREFPTVRIIRNSKNKGVAPARKQGMEIAAGKYILILDADTELIENSLKCLFDYMEKNKECGLAGCKLVDSNMNLQYSCKKFPSLLAFVFRRLENLKVVAESNILRKHIMMDWDHNNIREVDYLIGACRFIRREVVEKIGYYDIKIFYGPEDIDYCLRVWKAGWKVVYYPFTKIIHHEQRITKRDFLSKISFEHLKGILYLYRKYGYKIKL
ncbi:MAG TPA: glycosyltransferase family 2 protein [Ignavibacteriaceae bacterium]|nr:glycosyltransferase family 2 protein [Ignavibacteriaceae bacterium]